MLPHWYPDSYSWGIGVYKAQDSKVGGGIDHDGSGEYGDDDGCIQAQHGHTTSGTEAELRYINHERDRLNRSTIQVF